MSELSILKNRFWWNLDCASFRNYSTRKMIIENKQWSTNFYMYDEMSLHYIKYHNFFVMDFKILEIILLRALNIPEYRCLNYYILFKENYQKISLWVKTIKMFCYFNDVFTTYFLLGSISLLWNWPAVLLFSSKYILNFELDFLLLTKLLCFLFFR